jgi:hypothetical protein
MKRGFVDVHYKIQKFIDIGGYIIHYGNFKN